MSLIDGLATGRFQSAFRMLALTNAALLSLPSDCTSTSSVWDARESFSEALVYEDARESFSGMRKCAPDALHFTPELTPVENSGCSL